MSIATTVLKQTTTTSSRMSTNIHRTESSTLASFNFDNKKIATKNLCKTKQLYSIGQQQLNNNKQTINNNTNPNAITKTSATKTSGILMESKTLFNVIQTESDNRRRHDFALDDERLLKILSMPPDEPLYTNSNSIIGDKNPSVGGNSILMQYEGTSSICNGIVTTDDYENQPPHDKRIIANHEVGAGENKSSTPQKFFSPATWNKIQRDLNSPSASCRVRAIRAIKSPTNSYYYNTSDDPQNVDKSVVEPVPEYPKTIQEVMKNVSVYVEIRSASDNRTAGVKSVIAKLGAKVMERLTKNTTHVVFKDGLQTTYNKAKSWNIPIVSILWFEACKRHLVLMDPKEYPISNLDMYENPDLYTQQTIPKRQKCIQPEALMKNLHRKIPKSKLLQGLKKMDESKNSSVSMSLVSSQTLNTTTKPAQSKRLSLKVNTIRKSVGTKTENKPKQTIQSMFEKQREKSRIENSQANESLDDVVNDSVVVEKTANQCNVIESQIQTVTDCTVPQKNDRQTTESTTNTIETATDELVLVTGNLHNRLTRRNSISRQTPTKVSPSKTTPQKIGANTVSMVGSARKRQTLFIPTMNATTEETEPSPSFAKIDATPDKTINKSIPMEICANPNMKKCNSQVRQLLDVELANVTISESERTITEHRKDLLKSTFRRRKTIYSPQPMDETKVHGGTIASSSSFSTPRRKTMHARGASMVKPLNCSPPEMAETQSCDAILTPVSRSIADKGFSNLNSSTSSLVSTPLIKSMSQIHLDLIRKSTSKSLLDEYTNTFNSKKEPLSSKRRTMGSIAMDIIRQRVENINRNVSNNQSMSEALNDSVKDTPTHFDPKMAIESEAAANVDIVRAKPQGRRLFAPPSLFPTDNSFISMATTTTPLKTDKKPSNKSASKRKRNELLTGGKPTQTIDDKKLKKPQKSRRSTLFFEDAPIKKINDLAKRPSDLTESTTNHAIAKNVSPVLVCTSMHQPQIDFINEAVQKLGTFELEDKVGAKTTHLVAFDTRRTINLLRGVIHGIWIVNYDWILKSVEANKWLPEADYELKAFSKAVEINRIERQAFGSKYRMDIFRNFQQFYISSNCVCKNLRELITRCYGKVTADKTSAHYIIDEKYRNDCINKNACQVHAAWILDSISAGKVSKIDKYILKSAS